MVKPDGPGSLAWQLDLPVYGDQSTGSSLRFTVDVPARCQNEKAFLGIIAAATDLANLAELVHHSKERTIKAREQELVHERRRIKAEGEKLARNLDLHAVTSKAKISELTAQLITLQDEVMQAELNASQIRELLATLK